MQEKTNIEEPANQNGVVTDWFKITPDAKSVSGLFWWNIGANVIVGAGAAFMDPIGALTGANGQVNTAFWNSIRAFGYIRGEKMITKRQKKGKPVKPEVADGFRTGVMFVGAGTNAFQMFDATTTAGRIAGGLAFLTYLGLGLSSLLIGQKKKKTLELAEKAFQAQIDLKKMQDQAVNNNIHPQNILHNLKEKQGYVETVAKISHEKEKGITALYRMKQATGYTITGRALFQLSSGIINVVKGDFITGICEICGGGAFTYGANEYRKKEDREVKGRMHRIAKRKVLFRRNDPSLWDKNGNGNDNAPPSQDQALTP